MHVNACKKCQNRGYAFRQVERTHSPIPICHMHDRVDEVNHVYMTGAFWNAEFECIMPARAVIACYTVIKMRVILKKRDVVCLPYSRRVGSLGYPVAVAL